MKRIRALAPEEAINFGPETHGDLKIKFGSYWTVDKNLTEEERLHAEVRYRHKNGTVMGRKYEKVEIGGKMKFKCPDCDASYVGYNHLMVHIRSLHRKFKCSVCLEDFKCLTDRLDHSKISHEGTYLKNPFKM